MLLSIDRLLYGLPILTYLLTYSTVQSPSWAANWFTASQEIPRISRNPKVHYPTHKRPPPVSILGQPNPVHIPTSHLLEIHPNIIHPSTPRSTDNRWKLNTRMFVTKGENRISRRFTWPSVALFAANFVYTTLVVNPDLCPKKLASEHGLGLTS